MWEVSRSHLQQRTCGSRFTSTGPIGTAGEQWVSRYNEVHTAHHLHELSWGIAVNSRSEPHRIVGLIGWPVAHSLSARMQQAAFDALGIPATYELWETPASELTNRIAMLRGEHVLGANVTIPHKSAVMPMLDRLDAASAQCVGAVNTIVRERTADGTTQLVGYNTDLMALRSLLRERFQSLAGLQMVVLGAGGAARAAVGAALLEGMDVWLAARRPDRAQDVLRSVAPR